MTVVFTPYVGMNENYLNDLKFDREANEAAIKEQKEQKEKVDSKPSENGSGEIKKISEEEKKKNEEKLNTEVKKLNDEIEEKNLNNFYEQKNDALKKYNEFNKTSNQDQDLFPIVDELLALNGLLDQHPTTGRYLSAVAEGNNALSFGNNESEMGTAAYRQKEINIIKGYRNKLFGAPFQFLDSVDARFPATNEYVGYEFLRNFLLHSSILHIYPGITKYTGGDDSRFKSIANIAKAFCMDMSQNNTQLATREFQEKYSGFWDAMGEIVKGFKSLEATKGAVQTEIMKLFLRSKLQRRLFGISFQYESYLRYVKLMAHGVALLLKLTGPRSEGMSKEYPNGTFVNPNAQGQSIASVTELNTDQMTRVYKFQTFDDINWGNYRMIEDTGSVVAEIESTYKKALGQVGQMMNTGSKIPGQAWDALLDSVTYLGMLSPFGQIGTAISALDSNSTSNPNDNYFERFYKIYSETTGGALDNIVLDTAKIGGSLATIFQQYNELVYDIAARVQSIEFMVEPVSASETYNNSTGPSRLKSLTDGVNSYGAEISFITNSGAATGLTKTFTNMAQGFTSELANGIGQIAAPFTGNFLSNLFSGAIGAITGNRFIYPDIYQSSDSRAEYQFTVNLSSPYGDVYNYYMNIVVPLCHLQALVLPKLKTSNSVNAPFMVRAFIPGLMTCEMGIIENMNIVKNPNANRVSVNNFPLDVKVTFGIHELYHALAMSPTDDGLSYINNETLKDYLCNLAGIYPTFNRDVELNYSAASMLKEQFDIWKQANRLQSTVILSLLGLI
jgi:hypothetical protein